MNPRIVLALSLAVVVALVAVVIAANLGRDRGTIAAAPGPGEPFAGAIIPPGVRAPDFELRDQDGETVRMRALRGEPVVVTFLYTHCEETCPPAAQQVKGALDRLGRDVPALAIAVDPPRDTPASARRFLTEARMLGRMDFLLGTEEELRPVWRGFAIRPQTGAAEHQARIVLVDAQGRQRVGFPIEQATPERIAHDLALLERG